MASQMTEQFMEALQHTEESGELDALVALFAENARLARLTTDESYQGEEGCRAFWHEYLHTFKEIHSTFTHVTESEQAAALEWHAEGSLAAGNPIEYNGVSIIEWQGDKVQHFRTYYDSAAFLTQEAATGDEAPTAQQL